MPLDVLLPDLLPGPDAPAAMRELRLPHLERWLARADRRRLREHDADAVIARAFRLPTPTPVAPITLAADGQPEDGTWLRADPVHLRIEAQAVSLHDARSLAVQPAEAAELCAALQALFAGDGLEFRAPRPDRWYVRVPEGEAPSTVPLPEARNRNVFGVLPKGNGRINWPSALTETQMLLSTHEVNARREAEGLPAINSVWFWGEGARPAVRSPYALIYADAPFAVGLGRLAGVRTVSPSAGIAGVDAVRADESVLAVLDAPQAALAGGNLAAWAEAAQRIDEAWFAPLGDALHRFEHIHLILPSREDTLVAAIEPRARWRWLRKRRPLAHHA